MVVSVSARAFPLASRETGGREGAPLERGEAGRGQGQKTGFPLHEKKRNDCHKTNANGMDGRIEILSLRHNQSRIGAGV